MAVLVDYKNEVEPLDSDYILIFSQESGTRKISYQNFTSKIKTIIEELDQAIKDSGESGDEKIEELKVTINSISHSLEALTETVETANLDKIREDLDNLRNDLNQLEIPDLSEVEQEIINLTNNMVIIKENELPDIHAEIEKLKKTISEISGIEGLDSLLEMEERISSLETEIENLKAALNSFQYLDINTPIAPSSTV